VGSVKGKPVGIPADEVTSLAVRRGDALKTLGLVGLIIGGGVAIFAATWTFPVFDIPCTLDCSQEE
jgi:hypothetical protein